MKKIVIFTWLIIGMGCTHVLTPVVEEVEPIDTWGIFVNALMEVESGTDSLAIGTKNDVGVLQLRPIMVAEANRIIGREEFTLEDRKSISRSVDIFNTIQNYYNPEHDMQLALKIHNPRAPLSYHFRVMNIYNDILKTVTK